MQRIWIVVASTAVLWASWAFAKPEAAARAYVLTIDGQSFEVREGKPQKVTLKDGTSHTVRVDSKRSQRSGIGLWTFEYPAGFSFDRDEDGDVSLLGAAGVSIDLIDAGVVGPGNARRMFDETMSEYDKTIRLGVAKNIRKSGPVGVNLTHAALLRGTHMHTDEDGERWVFELAVLRSRGHMLMVTLTYEQPQAKDAKAAVKIVLDSLRLK